MEIKEERISELKGRSTEIIQSKKQKGKRLILFKKERKKEKASESYGIISKGLTCIYEFQKDRKERKQQEKIWKK